MKRLLAAIMLIPAAIFIQLSMMIDSEIGAEWLTEYFKAVCDKAGLRLTDA